MFFIPLVRVLSAVIVGATILVVPARAEGKRLALVIGNSAYENIARLTNPVNDATDIAEKLRGLQFDVLLATNANQAKMISLLQEFKVRLMREDVALFFYAGHGVTVNNESFLLPVDVPQEIQVDESGQLQPETVNRQLVSMATVLSPLETSKIGIMFLDACRTNAASPGLGLRLRTARLGASRTVPVVRGTGSLEIRPSPYSAGVFRAYATQLDNVAADGADRNSPFTKALLKHIGTNGLSIQELMIRVRRSVMEETSNSQVPWEEAALKESFFFVPSATPSSSTLRPGSAKSPAARPGNPPTGNKLPPNLGVGIGTGL